MGIGPEILPRSDSEVGLGLRAPETGLAVEPASVPVPVPPIEAVFQILFMGNGV